MASSDLNKQNLLGPKKPEEPQTFAQAIMGDTFWAQARPVAKPDAPKEIPSEDFSEKGQVLESLERFALEKLESAPGHKFPVLGGEIALKPEPVWEGVSRFSSQAELIKSLSVSAQILDILITDKRPEAVQIMFVTDKFRSPQDFLAELQQGFINQLLTLFPLKTAEFFNRMLLAMKLSPDEVLLYAVQSDAKDISSEVMSLATYYNPQVVVTLGATPTHKILKHQERLTAIHGQFFNRTIQGVGETTIVPLFHPSIIESNQNMKKTAWSDMQKIMKYLKKL